MTHGTSDVFAEIDDRARHEGHAAALAAAAEHFRREGRLHELFDLRLMEGRLGLGLPALSSVALDELPEPARGRLEERYLEACREVGRLFLEAGKFREAWLYLRPAGLRDEVAAALAAFDPDEARLAECIEVAVHQGVAPEYGIAWVLAHYGTCNAISTTEAGLHQWSAPEQQAVVERLVRHVHHELLENVRRDIARNEGQPPMENTLAELVADRDWLFAGDNYHLDTSHLNATVRMARLLGGVEALELAWNLTEYGRRLSRMYRYPGDEPFADAYVAGGLFFAAQLGRQVDEAVAYFRRKAEELPAAEHGSGPAEVYVGLLARLGRAEEALEAAAELLPAGVSTSGFAPSLFELAQQAGCFRRLEAICRQRDDLLGYLAALAHAAGPAAEKRGEAGS